MIQGGTTVFINSLLEQDRPMFAKQKIAFTPQVRFFLQVFDTDLNSFFLLLKCLVSSPSYGDSIRSDHLGSDQQHSAPTRHSDT